MVEYGARSPTIRRGEHLDLFSCLFVAGVSDFDWHGRGWGNVDSSAMKANIQFETWQIALPRRVATLARMHPLHRFEASKAARNIDLAKHDLRTLSLMVFDAVIERMGLAPGAPRDEIIEALRPIIIAAEPNSDFVRVAEVATAVLDFLMNEEERRRAFREEMLVVENGVQVSKEVSFHYLQQVLGANDEPLYRATVEGINLYTGTLGLDVEDAHAANAAVLKYQIGRGRFREAVATARQAVAITIQYEQKVRRALDIARRDITAVNWAAEVLQTLGEARDHLRTRIDADNEILRAVEDHEDDANIQERGHIAELVRHIRECQSRNSALHVLVMDANESWLGEHTRQAFRPRALGVMPDLEASVLRSSLMVAESRLDLETSWQLTAIFLPPSPPCIADGRRLIELLLAPRREYEGANSGLSEPEAEEMTQSADRFAEQDYRDADTLLESAPADGAFISDLLLKAQLSGLSKSVQTLIYLLALRAYGEAEENPEYRVDPADHCFTGEPFWGDDLVIRPAPKLEDVTHE
jgi:hypothetical protein